MNTDPTAVKLTVDENLLHITWGDEHTSRYDGAYLRKMCPCANCRGHAPGEKEPPSYDSVKDVKVTHVALTGTYALRLTFTDAHDTGIYAFQWLRDICPSTRDDVDDAGRPI